MAQLRRGVAFLQARDQGRAGGYSVACRPAGSTTCHVQGPHLPACGRWLDCALRSQQGQQNSKRPACCLWMNSSGSSYFPALLLSKELGNPSQEGVGRPGHTEPLSNRVGAFPVSLQRSEIGAAQ